MTSQEQLFNSPCCAGDGHTIRQGGSHINIITLRKAPTWPYLALSNFLVPESKHHPLACAVVCDSCLIAKKEIKYAMAGVDNNGGVRYYRVPLIELREPELYWPDYYPGIRWR